MSFCQDQGLPFVKVTSFFLKLGLRFVLVNKPNTYIFFKFPIRNSPKFLPKHAIKQNSFF